MTDKSSIIKWYVEEVLKADIKLNVPPLKSPKKESKAGSSVSKIMSDLIEGEESAIKQYEEAMSLPELQPYKSTIKYILGEEKEHLELLQKAKSKIKSEE
jgi:rubrerythrin